MHFGAECVILLYMIDYLIEIVAGAIAAIVVLTFHEFSHAFVAYKCGDPTAKFYGRMTLNPFKHFDPLGLIMFATVGFGWAKPVPINPNNFRNYRAGSFWTSAAGVITNYIMAFVFYPLLLVMLTYVCPLIKWPYLAGFIESIFYFLFAYSLNFCVFNLLPFYPLDGFRIIDALTTNRGKFYWFLRKYGYYIFLGLMAINILARWIPILNYVNVYGYVMQFAVQIFGKPITLFWNHIFGLFI